MRSAVEIFGVRNGLGTVTMCLQCNIVGWLACRIADSNNAWGQGQCKMHQFRAAPSWCRRRVVVDEAFSLDWRNMCFVKVIRTIDLLVGRFVGITA